MCDKTHSYLHVREASETLLALTLSSFRFCTDTFATAFDHTSTSCLHVMGMTKLLQEVTSQACAKHTLNQATQAFTSIVHTQSQNHKHMDL